MGRGGVGQTLGELRAGWAGKSVEGGVDRGTSVP